MNREQVFEILGRHAASLGRNHGVAHLSVFGSVARGDAKPESDVDILVEFLPGARVGMFAFIRLKDELETLLGRPVDLVTIDALRPTMRAQILREAVLAA